MSAGRRFYCTAAAFVALTASWGPALASGGGGGGGGMDAMPSQTAPAYDPAQEYQSGMAAYQASKFKDAARSFGHATEGAPGDGRGWYMLGAARLAGGDAKGAKGPFEHALKIEPDAIDAQRDYAVDLAKLGQGDKAQAALDKLKARAGACAETCPDAADLSAAVAAVEQALAPAAQAKPAAALATPSSLVFAPQGDAAYVRAVSLINERRYPEALAALDKAQAAFGAHPDVLTYQGYVWRKLGRFDQAESHYRAALAIAPEHRGATEYYGELKVIEGDTSGARALLARLDKQCAYGCVEAEELRRWIALGRDPAS